MKKILLLLITCVITASAGSYLVRDPYTDLDKVLYPIKLNDSLFYNLEIVLDFNRKNLEKGSLYEFDLDLSHIQSQAMELTMDIVAEAQITSLKDLPAVKKKISEVVNTYITEELAKRNLSERVLFYCNINRIFLSGVK